MKTILFRDKMWERNKQEKVHSQEEPVKLLDVDLEYVSHEIDSGTLFIHVVSSQKKAVYPCCGKTSCRVHDRYERRFRDLPI